MPVVLIAGIVFFSLILLKATDLLVVHLKALAEKTHLGGYFLSTVIVGLATSFPELTVAVTSSLSGAPNLALGNAIGSNIANLSLVAGLAALVAGSIAVRNHSYSSDLIHAFMAGLAPLFLLMDNVLSRVDGLILISLYGFYNYFILRERNKEMLEEERSNVFSFIVRRLRNNGSGKHIMFIFLSLALLLFSGDMMVKFAIQLSDVMQIPVLLVGIFFITFGTTLPELLVEYKAIRRRDTSLFMGNVLGTIVANGTLVVGITALIAPITIQAFNEYILATVFFLSMFTFFYFFIKTKSRLDRWEGFVLLATYAIFAVLEFM